MTIGNRGFWGFALNYSFRSLWRNPRRTILTVLTVMMSVWVAIVAESYATAVMKLWRDGAADTGTAHLQLHRQGYWTKQEGVQSDLTLTENDPLDKALRQDPRLAEVVRRLEIEGLMATDDESVYFLGSGVEPNREMAVSPRLFTDNDTGSFVANDNPKGIAIGQGLAKLLNLELGDEVTLIAPTVTGSNNGIDATIVGLVDAAIPSFSRRIVFAHIDLLRELIRLPNGYTELGIKLIDGDQAEAFAADHGEQLRELGGELRGWWQVEPVIKNVERIIDSVVILISTLLFLSATLSVLNIIYMVVYERTVEIGMLMAIGATGSKIRLIFATEAAVIGLLGGGAGALVGLLTVGVLGAEGMKFDSPFGAEPIVVFPQVHLTVIGVIFVVSVLDCLVAALAPSARAAKVEPVVAFRGQVN